MEYNESALIHKAAAGDPNAFNRLMENHEQRMYAAALRMCGNREDAQDCMVEAMMRIYRAIGSFKGDSAFSTWAYRITINTCLDELRRRKKKQSASVDELLESGWSPRDPGMTPEQQLISRDAQSALNEAIRQLPEDMRAAIILRDIRGYSYEEISGILSVNVGTIKSRISRGREKLRSIIQKNPELFGHTGV